MKTSYGWKLLPYPRPYRLRFFWELDFPFCRQKPDLPPVYDVLSANVVTAAIDDHLNEQAFIVPGLGDAGDRQFGSGG